MQGIAQGNVEYPYLDIDLDLRTFSHQLLAWLSEQMNLFRFVGEIDQRLLRSTFLHRLLSRIRTRRMAKRAQRTLCARVGFHLQRELTLLLLETPPTTHDTILGLPNRVKGLSAKYWPSALLGASGEAYVVRTLVERPNAIVHLPTIEDDLRGAIDLFWRESGVQHAITVKTRHWGNDQELVRATNLQRRPTAGWHPLSLYDMDRIWCGARAHQRIYGTQCTATAVSLSVPTASIVHLRRTWPHERWPETILETSTQRLRRA